MNRCKSALARALPALVVLVLVACGAGGSSSEPEWFYHFVCHGDPDCLETNFAGAPSGTSSQGPGKGGLINCQSLMHFGTNFWGPAAEQWCDNSSSLTPGGGGGGDGPAPTISGFTPASGAPGSSVTITGIDFPARTSDVTVTIAGIPVTVTAASATQLVITIPVTTGNASGPIVVTTSGGSASSPGTFTVVVPDPLAAATIRKIAPGYTHTCAILADDTVKCWGANESGQLGDGSTATRAGAVTVAVAGGASPIDIAVGSSFSCGVFGAAPGAVSGSVRCWGKGTSGQLGDGSSASSATPVEVTSISSATEVSARANHACALLTSGLVKCWGAGDSGQLGNGGTSNSPVPVDVRSTGPDNYAVVNSQTGEPASTKAFQVSAGDAHTCARVSISNGSAGLGVKCWGATNHGELGNGAPMCQANGTICEPKNPNPVPRRVAQLSNALRLAAGAHHTCVALTGGQLRCWGQGDQGQLGNNAKLHSNLPVVVFTVSGATMASAGSEFSCAAAGAPKSLKCWGRNDVGQLGDGTATTSAVPVTSTAVAAGEFEPTSLMGGDRATCLKRTDGTGFCFP